MSNKGYFPEKTAVSIKLEKLIKTDGKRLLSERMSSRMVKCASSLETGEYIGWQMAVPVKGRVSISLFGTVGLSKSDLEWFAEKTGKVSKGGCTAKFDESLEELYEVYLPVAESIFEGTALGFGGSNTYSTASGFAKWPAYYSAQFKEIVSVLKKIGGFLRVVVGSASEKEQAACRKNTLRTYDVDGITSKDYIGRPVKIRVLLLLPCATPIRLITVFEEAVQGAKLRHLGKMKEAETVAEWNAPIANAVTLPDYAARILTLEPELHSTVILSIMTVPQSAISLLRI